jgi:hypothetical protein
MLTASEVTVNTICPRIFYFLFQTRPEELSPQNIGDDRDRTDNLCLARAALSQLSYVPVSLGSHSGSLHHTCTQLNNFTVNKYHWAYVDSNHGPQLYQSCALTI